VAVTLAANYALGGLDVTGYHLFNIAVHLGAGLALYGLVRRTLRLPSVEARLAGAADGIALVTALVWIVHPLQTQAVTYVIQRCESMMGLFFLLTMYCYVRGATSPRAWAWYALALATFCLGLGSKEVMVTVLPVLWLYDRVFLATSWREMLRRRGWLHLAFAVPLAAAALVIGPDLFHGEKASAGFGIRELTSWEYARSQPGVILHYLWLSLRPHPQCFDYAWPVENRWLAGILLPGLAVLGSLIASVGGLLRGWRIGFLGVAFVLILAPTSGVMPVLDLCVEHRMYLPLACVVLAGVLTAYECFQLLQRKTPELPAGEAKATGTRSCGKRGKPGRIQDGAGPLLARGDWAAAVAAGTVIAAFAYTALQRNRLYDSAEAVWTDVIAQAPWNPRAYNNLGALLLDRQPERARQYLERALELAPSYAEANRNFGLLLARQDRLAESREYYLRALSVDPSNVQARLDLAACLVPMGRFAEAASECQAVLQREPGSADAHVNLAAALLGMGRTGEAMSHAREALRWEPRHALAQATLGQALAETAPAEALQQYTTALAIAPDSPDIPVAIANLIGRSRPQEAIAYYQIAVQRNPRNAEAHFNLANTWVRLGFPDRAIPHLRAALLIRPDWKEARENLALLSEAGRTPGARQTASASGG
jgi:tetratricopeptide (TPR) repeat protein